MKPNSTRLAMIRLFVKKGIDDIKDSPERGIRNLLEMGELFSNNQAQKNFLQTVLNQLRSEKSAYYPLIELLVRNTDADTLTNICMNLGYNSLSYGAEIIRSVGQAGGFHVPWCLQIETDRGDTLPPTAIKGLVGQGMPLGIYCYLIKVDREYPKLLELVKTLGSKSECSFVLLLPATVVSDSLCAEILASKNIAAIIDLEHGSEAQLISGARMLVESGCLCGGYMCVPENGDVLSVPELLDRTRALGLPIFINVAEKTHRPHAADDVDMSCDIVTLRKNLNIPVFPIDLYADIARVDRHITGKAHHVCVKSDGRFAATDKDGREALSEFNIKESSLRQALGGLEARAKSSSSD